MAENDNQYENNLEENEDDDLVDEDDDWEDDDDFMEEETEDDEDVDEEEEEPEDENEEEEFEDEEQSEEEESESKKGNEEMELDENEWNTSEVEGLFCPICMEPWTSQGDHHVSSLPCGHLFGLSCITKWIERKGDPAKCPQCNGKFRLKDVRRLFAAKIAAIEEASRMRIQYLEAKCATFKKQHSKWLKEIHELKRKIDSWESKFGRRVNYVEHQLKASLSTPFLFPWSWNFVNSTSDSQGSCDGFVFQGELQVDSALLFDIDPFGDQVFLLARKHKIGGSYYLTKVSLMASHDKEDISLPSQTKKLKDLHFSPSNAGLALVVSLDKKISVISLKSNKIIQTYELPIPASSCSWDINNPHYVYAGLKSGELMVFDIRQTKTSVESIMGLSSDPIHTIHSLQHDPTVPSGVRTLLSASTDGVCQWNFGGSEERPLQVPETSNPGECIALAHCPLNNEIVASYRPRAEMFNAVAASEQGLTPSSSVGQRYFMGIHLHLKRTGNSFEKLGIGCGTVSETRFPRTAIVGLEKEKSSFAAADETSNALLLQELPSFAVTNRFKSNKHYISDVKCGSTSSQYLLGCLSEDNLQLFRAKLA